MEVGLTIPSYERGVARLLRYDRHPWPANTQQTIPMFNHELILNHIDDIFGQDMHMYRTLSGKRINNTV